MIWKKCLGFVGVVCLGALTTTGCANGDGIWMIYVEVLLDDPCQDQQISHNFSTAYLPQDTGGSDWTETDEGTISDQMFFAQLIETDATTGVLVIDDNAYPGTRDKKTWTFNWEGNEDTEHTSSYLSQYSYSENRNQTTSTTFVMTMDGDAGSGSIDVDANTTTTWTESDSWGEDVGMFMGQIPAANFLVEFDDDLQDEVPASNSSTDSDCSSGNCEISISTQCTTSRGFTATLTGYGGEYDYEGLEDAGQHGGA